MRTAAAPYIHRDIKPLGIDSVTMDGRFDDSLAELQILGYEVISVAQNAELRIHQGAKASVSHRGNLTREGIIYTPHAKPILVKNSPILMKPSVTTTAEKLGFERYLRATELSRYLSEETDFIEFPEEYFEIPTNRFGEEGLTVFLFGGEQKARRYGEFLAKEGVYEMPVNPLDKSYVYTHDRPFARQLYFGGANNIERSRLCGTTEYLSFVDCKIRGVRPVAMRAGEINESIISDFPQEVLRLVESAALRGGRYQISKLKLAARLVSKLLK